MIKNVVIIVFILWALVTINKQANLIVRMNIENQRLVDNLNYIIKENQRSKK